MPTVELAAGPIEYEDTGGGGPVLVFLHGLLLDGAQWRHVVADRRRDFRCVLPTLPMGAHRRPMHPDADLSLRGLGRIIAEFLAATDLSDVTLCFNDWWHDVRADVEEVDPRRRHAGLACTACPP